MKKFALLGVAGLSLVGHSMRCANESEAEKAAKGLDKIYEEPITARTAAELEASLQTQSKTSG